MIEIESLDDRRIAAYQQAARPAELAHDGLFVVEGRLVVPRLLTLSAAPGRWWRAAQSVLLSPSAFDRLQLQLAPYPEVPVYVVPQAVMNGLVGFNLHRGCLALARRPAVEPLGVAHLQNVRTVLVLEGVNNPDNVGGIFRSAAAFGADLVVLGPGCADPLYRKSVRTSMGATLEVPFVSAADWPGGLDLLRTQGCTVAALTTEVSAVPLARFGPPDSPIAILAGAEGTGLSAAALTRADVKVTIPMSGRVDSLNVATAVSIALYHVSAGGRP